MTLPPGKTVHLSDGELRRAAITGKLPDRHGDDVDIRSGGIEFYPNDPVTVEVVIPSGNKEAALMSALVSLVHHACFDGLAFDAKERCTRHVSEMMIATHEINRKVAAGEAVVWR